MTKFVDRIIEAIGQEITVEELASQCEINKFSYDGGEAKLTASLIKCEFGFVEFRVMPASMLRCFCGKSIKKCFVINHMGSGKQFVLGRTCLFSIFGDRLKAKCKRCGVVSTKENRVSDINICKACSLEARAEPDERGERAVPAGPLEPFQFDGSDRETYIKSKEIIANRFRFFNVTFGQHKGLSYGRLFEIDRRYCFWLLEKYRSKSLLRNVSLHEFLELMFGLEFDRGLVKLTFGKYAGKTIQEVSTFDIRYLYYLKSQNMDNRPIVRECLDKFLE